MIILNIRKFEIKARKIIRVLVGTPMTNKCSEVYNKKY
jgi:hypothetical protein